MKQSLLTLTLLALISGCGSGSGEQKEANENVAKEKQTTVKEDSQTGGNSKASAVIDEYLAIKSALVSDSQEEAAISGAALSKALDEINLNEIPVEKQDDVKEIIEVAKNHGEHIAKSDIAHQREHFESLSKDIKDLVTITGTDRTLYHQYCPMYNDNKGGMWLSDSEEIRNPLFGSKMLKCGKVEDIIRQ